MLAASRTVNVDDGFVVTVMPDPERTRRVVVSLRSNVADALVRYRETGQLTCAAALVDSPVFDAEELMQENRWAPIAASAGAYALLRLGRINRLHDWTQNLMDWFPWLPDGLAIRAEHLARIGDHIRALTLLSQLSDRGLPVFTDGFSYAVDRLEQYSRLVPEFNRDIAGRGVEVLRRLHQFAAVVDFSQPVLTYAAAVPWEPSTERSETWESLPYVNARIR